MKICAGSAEYISNPGNLPYTMQIKRTAPTGQRELDHTDHTDRYVIRPEIFRS